MICRSPPLLRGKTALILGYGVIGELVRDSLLGLGMRVKAIKRNPAKLRRYTAGFLMFISTNRS